MGKRGDVDSMLRIGRQKSSINNKITEDGCLLDTLKRQLNAQQKGSKGARYV
jgi:hypothetical protein